MVKINLGSQLITRGCPLKKRKLVKIHRCSCKTTLFIAQRKFTKIWDCVASRTLSQQNGSRAIPITHRVISSSEIKFQHIGGMQTKFQTHKHQSQIISTPRVSVFLQKQLSRTDFKARTSSFKVRSISYIKSLHDNKQQRRRLRLHAVKSSVLAAVSVPNTIQKFWTPLTLR